MLHHKTDPSFSKLAQAVVENPRVRKLVGAATLDHADLPKYAFAWEEERAFPIDTPANAAASYLYVQLNDHESSKIPLLVKMAVEKAVRLHGVDPKDLTLELTKEASVKTPKSETAYLLPHKRRWAVSSPEHVKLAEEAIRNVRKDELTVAERTKAAKLLVKRAAEMSVQVTEETKRLAGETASNIPEVVGWLDVRATLAPHAVPAYQKVAEYLAGERGYVYDTDELLKLAYIVEEVDNAAGVAEHYGRQIPNPIDTVFNTYKEAGPTIDLGGTAVPVSKVVNAPPELLNEIFGEELLEEAISADGELDPGMLITIMETMPRDLKRLLARQLA